MDQLMLTLAHDGGLRLRAAITTHSAHDVIRRHAAGAGAGRVLANALTAVALLPIEHAKHDRVSIQWVGRGVVKQAFAELRMADGEGHLRAFVGDPKAPVPTGTSGIYPPGRVVVMRQRPSGDHDLGQGALLHERLDTSLEAFMRTSDQVATALFTHSVGEGDDLISGGVLVQRMPDGPDLPTLDRAAVARAVERQDLNAMLDAALPNDDRRQLSTLPLQFACPCSSERARRGILMLEPHEIQEHIDDGEMSIDCQFCGEQYRFDRAALQSALEEKQSQA